MGHDANPHSINGSTSLTLLERAKQNESVAWHLLVDLYAPIVYLRCRNQWHFSRSDAEEVGQEVFVAVARRIGQFDRRQIGSFRTWLRTIVDNKCRDMLRKKNIAIAAGGTHAKQLIEGAVDKNSDLNPIEDAPSEKAVLLKQAIAVVEAEFSSRDWEIFWKICVDGVERQILAEQFEVSDNVVYLAYSRIRKRLNIVFQDLLDDDIFE